MDTVLADENCFENNWKVMGTLKFSSRLKSICCSNASKEERIPFLKEIVFSVPIYFWFLVDSEPIFKILSTLNYTILELKNYSMIVNFDLLLLKHTQPFPHIANILYLISTKLILGIRKHQTRF